MGFLSKSLNCFKRLDLFGIRPTVYFEGKRKSGTLFGFALTLQFLIFTTICFWYFGKDFYYSKNPIIRTREEFVSDPEKIVLDPEATPIILELNSPLGDIYFTDPRMITVNVSQLTIAKSFNETIITSEHYPMEICTRDHFKKLDKISQQYFLQRNLQNFFCIPRDLKNLTMAGSFDQDFFQHFFFNISICQNSNNCLPKSEIKNIMRQGFIGIYFLDLAVDVNDYEQPHNPQPKELFTNFDLKTLKEVDLFFRNQYIYTDDGAIFSSSRVQKISSFSTSTIITFNEENDNFLMINFKVKQERGITERVYSKLQDVLARIGGFLNFFYLISMIINHFYSNLFVVARIIENVFSILIINESAKQKSTPKEQKRMSSFPNNQIQTQTPQLSLLKECSSAKEVNTSFKEANPSFKEANLSFKDSNLSLKMKNSSFSPIRLESLRIDKNKHSPDKKKKIEISFPLQRKRTPSEVFDFENPTIPIKKSSIEEGELSPRIAQIKKHHQLKQNLKDFKQLEALDLGFLDYVYYYFGFFKSPERQRKKIIIKKGSSILRQCLDIKFIIQKFYEIEKLKHILLNECDLKAFANLPRPELSLEIEKGKKTPTVTTNVFSKQVTLGRECKKNKE